MGVAPSTENFEDAIHAGMSTQVREADSKLDTSLDSAVDTSSIFDRNSTVSSWSPEQCFENGAGPAPQDFGNVLSQLGIGVPSNFWYMDRTNIVDLPDIDVPFVNMQEDSASIPQLLGGSLHGQTPFSDYTSPSSTSTGCLTNGKVSSIESLTRRMDNSSSFQEGSEPPAIYIRKNETAGHYVG